MKLPGPTRQSLQSDHAPITSGGKERANALVRKALGDVYRRLGEQWWRANESTHVGENMALAFASFAKGDAVEYSVRAQSQDTYEIDVTECRYAQFYK